MKIKQQTKKRNNDEMEINVGHPQKNARDSF